MTAPLDLAALKALYEAATKGPLRSQPSDRDLPGMTDILNSYSRIGATVFREDAAFYVAAHTHWLELLAMAGENERLKRRVDESERIACEHRTARHAASEKAAQACAAAGDRNATIADLNARNQTLQHLISSAVAEKAALAERLAIAMRALETIDAQVNVIDFHATALSEHAIVRTALATIAAHEAERGKE